MGRLAGFSYREVTKRLRAFGFEYDRPGKGSHEAWWNPETRRHFTIPHHPGDIAERTLRSILEQAGITPEQFLSAR